MEKACYCITVVNMQFTTVLCTKALRKMAIAMFGVNVTGNEVATISDLAFLNIYKK